MMQVVLAYFGYVKIPVEVIKLSTAQEVLLEEILDHESSATGQTRLKKYLRGQEALTKFLRSGRKIAD